MFAVLFQRGGDAQKLHFVGGVRRQQIRDVRLAFRDGPGLVQRDYLHASGGFQRGGGLE